MRRSGSGTARILRLAVLATFGSLLTATVASAQGGGDWGESRSRWSVFGAVFWPKVNTSIQFTSDTLGVSGTLLDLESDLGLSDSDTLPIGGIRWRVAKRHELELLYFQLKRSGDQTLAAQLSVPCDTVNSCMPGVPNAPNTCGQTLCILDTMVLVNSSFDTQVLRLAYTYAFLMRENYELRASVGVHVDSMEIKLRDMISGGGSVLGQTLVDEVTVPLPSFGLDYRYRFSPRWSLSLNGEWFGIEIGELEGDLRTFKGGVIWDVWQSSSLFFAWNYFELDISVGDSDFKGLFNWNYSGPVIGFSYGF